MYKKKFGCAGQIEKDTFYQVYTTGDGSPTLVHTRAEDKYVEKMHNSKGAYAESLYIYGDVLAQALEYIKPQEPFIIGSLGLGLAYNEIISIARLANKNVHQYKIISFEKDSYLTEQFLRWLNNDHLTDLSRKPTELTPHYQWILEQTAKDHQIAPQNLKQKIQNAIEQQQWQIRGEFPQQLEPQDQFHLFYYDAFSNKMSPELWTEDTLKNFIKNYTAPSCMISTYAATGALKRALKENQFQLQQRPGFGGKRESILGIR